MSNPTTPAEALAEQERVLALLDKSAPEPWEIGNFRRYAVFSLHPDASRRPVVTVRHFEGDIEPMDGEAQANLQLCAAAPTLARQYAALLAAHAEALERERWIPVSERLPEESVVDILALFKTGDVYPVVVSGEGDDMWFKMYCSDTHIGYFKPSDLTHWRPLPAPPAPASAEGASHE